jgi:hypothetical protein
MTHKIIFDTDPGIDDAMALLFIEASPALDLLAITTIFGNSDIETTTRNALYLKRRFGLSAPVYKGADKPLTRPRNPSPTFVHGENGLGDVELTGLVPAQPEAKPAHRAIIDIAREHPGEVTLVAVGPLTNLALALKADPEVATLLKAVVIMGGAFGVAGKPGNVTPVAEANIWNDPEAADLVFTAPWPVDRRQPGRHHPGGDVAGLYGCVGKLGRLGRPVPQRDLQALCGVLRQPGRHRGLLRARRRGGGVRDRSFAVRGAPRFGARGHRRRSARPDLPEGRGRTVRAVGLG